MKKFMFAALLLLCGRVFADGGCVNDIALKENAQRLLKPIPTALVRVCTDSTCATLATVYSTAALSLSITNPVTADARGNYSFCAAPGQYTVKVIDPVDSTFYIQPQVTVPVALSGDLTVKSINGVRYADQFVSINAAIADLPSGGGTVYLADGTYAKFTVSKSNVRIIGGRGAVIQSGVAADNVITVNAGLSNIVIDGISIDAGGKTLDEANFAQGNCLYAVGTKVSPITNLSVTNTYCTDGHNGIYYQYVNGGKIVGNDIVFSHAGLAEVSLDGSNSITVSHNTFSTTGGAANAVYVLTRTEHGFPNDPSNHHTILQNTISGNFAYEGINVFTGENVISGNTISITSAAANSSGISVQSTFSQTLPVTNANVIVGNTISISGVGGVGNVGIGLGTSTAISPYDNVIADNYISMNLSGASAAQGIFLVLALRSQVVNNRIVGVAGMYNGISISNTTSADNTVSLNTIENTVGQGISFVGTNETITGNTIISPGASGIFLPSGTTGTNSTVAFNTVRNGADRGIAISSNLATNLGVYGNNSVSNAVVDFFGTNTYRDIPQAGAFTGALNGTVGATTPSTGVFTTISASGLTTATGGIKLGASGSTISDSRELIQNAHSCGTTTTCANTANGSNRVIFGTVALSSGTPSTATVASITAFTSTSSYVCVLTNMTNAANNLLKVVNTSTTSFTITGPNTITDTIAYQCIGN